MQTAMVLERFLLSKKVYCSAKTTEWYAYFLSQFISFCPELGDMNEETCERFIIIQRTRPRADDRRGPLHVQTVAGAVRALQIFARWCAGRGYIQRDPTVGLRPPREATPPKALTQKQLGIVLQALRDGDWYGIVRDRALLLFLLDSGCRASEVLNLDIASIDWDEGTATVTGKGNRTRRVAISVATLDALRTYLSGRDSGPVFLTADGKPLRFFGLREILRRLSARINIHLNAHLFRHSCASALVRAGADPSAVQTLLGHASLTTTQRYFESVRVDAAIRQHRKYSPVMLATQDVS